MIYRNGKKRTGNVHTSSALVGVWDLQPQYVNDFPHVPYPDVSRNIARELNSNEAGTDDHDTPSLDMLDKWLENDMITEVVGSQGGTPWMEARMGQLTGTTSKNVLNAIKHILVDDRHHGVSYKQLFQILGAKLSKPSRASLEGKSLTALRKSCIGLGYDKQELGKGWDKSVDLLRTVNKMHVSPKLVFEKIVKAWCMAPIKSRSKNIQEAFRKGHIAEKETNKNIAGFINYHSRNQIEIERIYNCGLIYSMTDRVSAVSPDAMSIIKINVPTEGNSNVLCQKLKDFFDVNANLEYDITDDGRIIKFVVTNEYKHKSSVITVAATERIVSYHLHSERLCVIDLGIESDCILFRNIIPTINYRYQVIHEIVTCGVPGGLFVVGTTSIQYATFVMVPADLANSYHKSMCFIRDNYLKWLFKPNTLEYDENLSRFPTYRGIKYSYAQDDRTVKCRLQVMMCLYKLRQSHGSPLPKCEKFLPRAIMDWNKEKGVVDDFSKVLSHNLGIYGNISAITVVVIRTTNALLFQAWRMHALKEASSFLFSENCQSYRQFVKERSRKGRPFVDFLKTIFVHDKIPRDLRLHKRTTTISTSLEPSAKEVLAVTRKMWNNAPEWINFRLAEHPMHRPNSKAVLMDLGIIPSPSRRKNEKKLQRKGSALSESSTSTSFSTTAKLVASSTEKATSNNKTLSPLETSTADEARSDDNNVYSEAPSCAKQVLTKDTDTDVDLPNEGVCKGTSSSKNQKELSPSTSVKKGRDDRSYCAYCTRTVQQKNRPKSKKGAPQKTSFFQGCKAKRKSKFCERCLVALCTDTNSPFKKVMTCFDRWHSELRMPDEDDMIDNGPPEDTTSKQESNSNDNDGENDSSDNDANTADQISDEGINTSDQVLI